MTRIRSTAQRGASAKRLVEGLTGGGLPREDRYGGRLAAGTEEDVYWRRLSDNWYGKDVIPSTYLEIHNQCYEAYNANPLANYIIEITTNFVLGTGISVAATNRKVQRLLDAFWEDPENHMATLLPWLRRYKDWLTDRVRINKYKGAFLWDIQLSGADAKTIDRKRMQYAYPPDPGSIIVHNESEQWSAVQPKIEAGDAEADGRAIKMMIAMGAGLPEHYLAEGGNVNRATAAEMGLPTFRKFQRRQDTFGLVIRAILDRVLEEATRVGALSAGVDRSYRVIFPELAPGDNGALATAASAVTPALLSAYQAGWVSTETAMRLFYAMTGQEINVAEELERIARERGAASSAG